MCIRDRRKKHKLSSTRIDVTSVRQPMKYPACGTGIHRLISRAASVKSMKRKFSSKMSTACDGTEYKYKKAMGDEKRKGLPDPCAYSPLTRNVLRKRKGMKFAGPFKNIVKVGTRTKGSFQVMGMRFSRSLENKTLLCEYADRKTKVSNAPQTCLLYTSRCV